MTAPRRVTAISHSAVLPANQALFARLAERSDLDLSLIAPRQWVSPLQGSLEFASLPGLAGRCHPLAVRRPGNLHLHTYPDLAGALRDLRPEVLYLDEDAHSLVAWQVLRLQRRLGYRLVATLKQNLPKRYPPPFGWIEGAVYRRVAAAAATSRECLEVAQAKGLTCPAKMVYYPVDTDAFAPAAKVPSRPFTVGYAGRLVPEKGVGELLEAMAMLPSGHLRIVGDGPLAARVEVLALTKFPPGTAEVQPPLPPEAMPAWYHSVDVLVLPSRTTRRWKEQFGRVLAEAMACGVPVVGSDSGFIPELIATTGGGLVVPEGDSHALAEALLRLAEDPPRRRALGEAGRAGVVAHYSIPVLAERLARLLLAV